MKAIPAVEPSSLDGVAPYDKSGLGIFATSKSAMEDSLNNVKRALRIENDEILGFLEEELQTRFDQTTSSISGHKLNSKLGGIQFNCLSELLAKYACLKFLIKLAGDILRIRRLKMIPGTLHLLSESKKTNANDISPKCPTAETLFKF